MRILELVVQGVPGSPELLRLKLGAGTTVLHPGAVPLPVGRLVAYALYDESVEPPPELKDPQATTHRVGVTVQDHQGAVYRMVRDLGTGAVQLAWWDAGARSFSTVSTRPAEAGQYLRSQARMPGEDLFRDLLWIRADGLPSRFTPVAAQSAGPRRPVAGAVMGGAAAAARYEAEATGGRGGPSASGFGAGGAEGGFGAPALAGPGGWGGGAAPSAPAQDPFAHLPLDARREKLTELERRKAVLDEADELQFALDGKQRALFESEQKRGKISALEKEVEGLEAALAEIEDVPAPGGDLERAIREYRFHLDRRDRALARIEEEREKLESRLEAAPAPAFEDRIFQAGAGAVVLFTVVAAVSESMRWLLFLNPLALGVVAFSLLEWIGEREAYEGLDGRRASLDQRAEKAVRDFEMDTTTVRGAMQKYRVEKVDDLLELMARRRDADTRLTEARGRLEALRSSPEMAAVDEETARLQQEIADLEARLRSSGAVGISPADLMRDIDALKASIARAESGAPPTGPEASDPAARLEGTDNPFAGLGGGSFEPAAGPSMPDPGPTFISRLADALQKSPETLGEEIRDRLGQYLVALTEGRWNHLSFGGRGALVIGPAGGQPMSWDALPPAEQDTAWLALRLGLAEAFVRHAPQPLLLEGALDVALNRRVWPLAAKMVRYLGSIGQAIHLTPERFWADQADAAHDLGAGE